MTATVPGFRERNEVAARADAFVNDLSDWLRIPSISADPGHHGDVARSAAWLADRLRADGWPQVEVWSDTAALPAVWAHWPAAESGAPTVLVYGHHDVQPADLSDGWSFEPFAPRSSVRSCGAAAPPTTRATSRWCASGWPPTSPRPGRPRPRCT